MFTPEQLCKFAEAGWSPDAIKEMLAYDTEVKKAIENGDEIKPEDVDNHIEEKSQPLNETNNNTASAESILNKMIGD